MHTTIDNATDDQSKYGAVVELPFPDVVPKDGSCAVLDLMRVVEVCEGPEKTPPGYYVELVGREFWPDGWEDYWGEILAEVAWAIAFDHSDEVSLPIVQEREESSAKVRLGGCECDRLPCLTTPDREIELQISTRQMCLEIHRGPLTPRQRPSQLP
jgi:hypothetical protein